MAELSDEDIRAIRDTHDKVIRIDERLGEDDKGLCGEVKNHGKRLTKLEMILLAIGIMVVTGAGGIGIAELVKGALIP